MVSLTSIELCTGAGGQALGLERAGFQHLALVEIEPIPCMTLKRNRPHWNVLNQDLRHFNARPYRGVDLLAAGVPCPPFSIAGKQLGILDERNLFPEVIRITDESKPKSLMIENVRGLLDSKFGKYRQEIMNDFEDMGYIGNWQLINAADFGVPQVRQRSVFIAMKEKYFKRFSWPNGRKNPMTVGEVLYAEMSKNKWKNIDKWKKAANGIAPTLVGGSKKHGGPDLGPTRARKEWAKLGVNGSGLADEPPHIDFVGMPKITVKMAALIQGFPQDYIIEGKKTQAYRQVGNAFPPPVAEALGKAIKKALVK